MVAALASYLQARSRGGRWLLRMDDLDTPRCSPQAASQILKTLEALNLDWDGPVLYQSRRHGAYREALERLRALGLVYRCACTRRQLGAGPYPGTCRRGPPAGRAARAVRVLAPPAAVAFDDEVQGLVVQNIGECVGDFVVRRADGLFAYQLACVVDDAYQEVDEVVRGADLIDSTPRQIHLQVLLGLSRPRYAHLPVVVDARGRKLSKQNHAPPVDPGSPEKVLAPALRVLGHPPPAELAGAEPRSLLAWARAEWRMGKVPRRLTLPDPALAGAG